MAVEFDAITDLLTGGTGAIPATTGTLAVSLRPTWAQSDAGVHVVFRCVTTASPLDLFDLTFSAGSWYAGWYSGGVDFRLVVAQANYTQNQNQWNRFIVTWDGNAPYTRLMLNGTQVGETATCTAHTTTANKILGNAPAGGYDCRGGLAEVAVWNYSLHAQTLAALSAGISPRTYPRGRTFYAPLHNVNHLVDLSAGESISSTGVASAVDHPRVYTPGLLGLGIEPAAAPSVKRAWWLHRTYALGGD